jgi:hypothetical protein
MERDTWQHRGHTGNDAADFRCLAAPADGTPGRRENPSRVCRRPRQGRGGSLLTQRHAAGSLDRPPLKGGCPGPWHIEECFENVDDRFGCLRLRSSYFQRPPEVFGWPIRDYRPRDRWTYPIYPVRELRRREMVGAKGAEPSECAGIDRDRRTVQCQTRWTFQLMVPPLKGRDGQQNRQVWQTRPDRIGVQGRPEVVATTGQVHRTESLPLVRWPTRVRCRVRCARQRAHVFESRRVASQSSTVLRLPTIRRHLCTARRSRPRRRTAPSPIRLVGAFAATLRRRRTS